MATLMCDHPAWTPTPTGAHRAIRHDATVWHLLWETGADSVERHVVAGRPGATPTVDEVTAPNTMPAAFSHLGTTVARLAPVLRVRNSDLWDAIGTAVIRQVIRADQARRLHARFSAAYGQRIGTKHGDLLLFPTAETVTSLPETAFTEVGLKFHRPALAAAATAYLSCAEQWAQLPAARLVDALQTVPRIGRWTAGAAVADYSGDFALYPYADLAVRTWARRAAPDTSWPDTEPAFAAMWRTAGTGLAALTLLTLAWGGTYVRTVSPDRRG
ncbi:hypothetical protein ACTOB_003754 [Actinoplanes oblitus]|uniref:HhH-GPD domain-containing protein n=1 Tax=Actinoplanes oblitus TaxID=3040509 RepID=A0ABY8WRI5_9ACTN|nr:hypothetical protein [Actinoplanes oblitus]WIN00073.1 hypothetical protein ACTOB_003754 [Actinoplanes oblitus]